MNTRSSVHTPVHARDIPVAHTQREWDGPLRGLASQWGSPEMAGHPQWICLAMEENRQGAHAGSVFAEGACGSTHQLEKSFRVSISQVCT